MDHALVVSLGHSASAVLGEAGRCLQTQDAATKLTYAVFSLPKVAQTYDLDVHSQVFLGSLVSPRLQLLGQTGQVVQTIEPSAFHLNKTGLTTTFHAGTAERFLIVVADPALLGQQVVFPLSLRDMGGVDVAGRGTIYIPQYINIATSHPQPRSPAYALNGIIRVSAASLPYKPPS